jgi:arylsulfatase A-like enzyme
MGDHTRPIGAHDLMMQVPLIYRQPGVIPPGRTSDRIVSNYDFLPTVLHYLGLGHKSPRKSPGRDYSPLLLGKETAWENEMYYEMEMTRAVRTDGWKLVVRRPAGPNELYDMAADPRERFNLYGQSKQAERTEQLTAKLDRFFGQHCDPEYDLWKGGRSKAGRLK